MSINPALNPIIALGAAAVGALAGVAPLVFRRSTRLQTALAVVLAHLVGQVGIKSIGKMLYFGMPWQGIFIGLGISALVGCAEFFILCWMRSNKSLEKWIGGRRS
jgi:hypothetical protein